MIGQTCTQTWFMSRVTAAELSRARPPPDAFDATCDDPLHLRQRADPAVLVADDGELADLTHRDQPLVGGVVLGDCSGR